MSICHTHTPFPIPQHIYGELHLKKFPWNLSGHVHWTQTGGISVPQL